MNNTIHEPEVVSDAKNALAYFLILGLVSLGLVFVVGGLVSPIFWPCLKAHSIEMSKQENGTYEDNLKKNLRMAVITLSIWFIVSWGLVIMAYWNGL